MTPMLAFRFILLLSLTAPAASAAWPRHTIDAGPSGADGVRLADINGDGHTDIATGWEEGGLIRVYLHPGVAEVRRPWPAVTVGRVKSPEDAVFVDLDGDGATDVISCSEGKTRAIHVHWAPKDPAQLLNENAWTTQPIPAAQGRQMWMFALPMHVDDRHGIDLVVGSKGADASVSWLEAPENPRDLAAWKLHKIVDAGWIMSLRAMDRDVIVSDRKGEKRGVYQLKHEGPGQFRRIDLLGTDHEWMFLDVGHWTHPDALDLAVATRNGKIVFREGQTGLISAVNNPFDVPHGKAVRLGDIDGDGRLDLVHTSNTGKGGKPAVAWLKFNAPHPFHADVPIAHDISGLEGMKYDRIELLDLDGDGDLDVLTCEENAGAKSTGLGVIWYENPTK